MEVALTLPDLQTTVSHIGELSFCFNTDKMLLQARLKVIKQHTPTIVLLSIYIKCQDDLNDLSPFTLAENVELTLSDFLKVPIISLVSPPRS